MGEIHTVLEVGFRLEAQYKVGAYAMLREIGDQEHPSPYISQNLSEWSKAHTLEDLLRACYWDSQTDVDGNIISLAYRLTGRCYTGALEVIAPFVQPDSYILVNIPIDSPERIYRYWFDGKELRCDRPKMFDSSAFKDPAAVIRTALYGSGIYAPHSRDKDRLRSFLKDLDPELRVLAASALWEASGNSASALPTFLNALVNDDRNVQRLSCERLRQMGPAAKDATHALIRLLNDSDPLLRWNSARALCAIGPAAEAALPTLRASLAQGDASTRIDAADAIWKISGDTESTIPVLQEILRAASHSSNEGDPWGACELLGRMGSAAKAVVPDLIRALASEDVDVANHAAEALGRIGEAEALPSLRLALRSGKWDLVMYSLRAIRKISPAVEEMISIANEGIRARDGSLLDALGHVLLESKDAAEKVIPLIAEAMQGDQDWVYACYRVLDRLWLHLKDPPPALARLAQSEDHYLRDLAKALMEKGPH